MPKPVKYTATTVVVKLDKYTQSGLDLLMKKIADEGLIPTKSEFVRQGLRHVFKENGITATEIKENTKKQSSD